MEKNLKFVKPKNEATAKFYTEVLKNRLGIEPNPFLPKKSAQTHITQCFLSLTQFSLHSPKSFRKPKLFYILSALYLLSFIPHELFFSSKKIVFSLNYTLGSLFLLYLVVLEYYRQVNSSDILNFSDNRMFYINWGVTVFYIGTLPLLSFWSLFAELKDLFSIYYIYFQISGIVMYVLFAVSFILGKENADVWKKQNS